MRRTGRIFLGRRRAISDLSSSYIRMWAEVSTDSAVFGDRELRRGGHARPGSGRHRSDRSALQMQLPNAAEDCHLQGTLSVPSDTATRTSNTPATHFLDREAEAYPLNWIPGSTTTGRFLHASCGNCLTTFCVGLKYRTIPNCPARAGSTL